MVVGRSRVRQYVNFFCRKPTELNSVMLTQEVDYQMFYDLSLRENIGDVDYI